MKQPERVAELLAELRALTENDFERHRIDVLEKDLTTPPQVEVIDDKHQRFNGEIYALVDSGHFAKHMSQIHRDVWQYFNGEIPEGYLIHHVDGKKNNNHISNLQILTRAEHTKLHHQLVSEYKICEYCGKEFSVKNFIGNHRFCSKACAEEWRRKKDMETKICSVCGKQFQISRRYSRTQCCSAECGHKLQATKMRVSLEDRICPICGKSFKAHKWQSTKHCSSECANKARSLSRQKPPLEKVCAICGKTFFTKSHTQFCCSTSCAAISQARKKKKKS